VSRRGSGDYMEKLDYVIVSGLRSLPARFSDAHAEYILGAQNADGGFSGREAHSDLYYSSFALRAAGVLGITSEKFWLDARNYIKGRASRLADVIDCVCILLAIRVVEISQGCAFADLEWDTLRTRIIRIITNHADNSGGFTASGVPSIYHTYLSMLCFDSIGETLPNREKSVSFVHSLQCEDGGFADRAIIDGAEIRGGVNPTAAAVGFLKGVDSFDDETALKADRFLGRMQADGGGVLAHERAPCPDIMSTFTFLVTMAQLGGYKKINLSDHAKFVRTLAMRAGGFKGVANDGQPDTEYTFYGLGCIGLFAAEAGKNKGTQSMCKCRTR